MQFRTKFIELLEKSTITQAYITICVVTTCCVMWAMGNTIPDTLQTVLVIVVGFFFGTKAATMAQKGK